MSWRRLNAKPTVEIRINANFDGRFLYYIGKLHSYKLAQELIEYADAGEFVFHTRFGGVWNTHNVERV